MTKKGTLSQCPITMQDLKIIANKSSLMHVKRALFSFSLILFLDSYVVRFTLPNILLKVSIGYGSSIMFANLTFHL